AVSPRVQVAPRAPGAALPRVRPRRARAHERARAAPDRAAESRVTLRAMRPASEAERRRLNDLFAELCAIPSPFGREAACAARVREELESLGLHVTEDDAAAGTGAQCGNLLARIPGRLPRSILLCAHVDTVGVEGPIEPVVVDDGWESAGETILGADNKAAVAVMLAAARRAAVDGAPVGIELLFTVSEENALAGAKAFDTGALRSDFGYVFDHATAIGDAKVDALVAEMIDRTYDAANDPACDVDVDVGVERLFQGYRHRPDASQVLAAEHALRACGYAPRRIVTGGASDANALEAAGFACTNLANGTERNHEPTERVSVAALESMLDVTFALLEAAAEQP